MNILAIVISIFASVVSGTALYFLKRYFDRRDEKDEERDLTLAKENILILRSINSIGKLTYANALAIEKGEKNGHMHDAMEIYEEVNDELYQYLLEQNSKK